MLQLFFFVKRKMRKFWLFFLLVIPLLIVSIVAVIVFAKPSSNNCPSCPYYPTDTPTDSPLPVPTTAYPKTPQDLQDALNNYINTIYLGENKRHTRSINPP
jgi:hypothetical protein